MLLQNMARTNIATNAWVKLRRLGIVFGDLCEARTLLDKEDASEEGG